MKQEKSWVQDGTSDTAKRSVASFIVGSLKDNSKGPYLINMKNMERNTTQAAYFEFFNESLQGFFGEGDLNSLKLNNFILV